MLTVYYASTSTLTATLTDSSGVAVTGATLALTIKRVGAAIAGETWPVSMTDAGLGTYTYTVADDLLDRGRTYTACILATKAGVSRYAEVPILVVVDDD